MYIPHYINAALPKTMSRTQQVRHTVKSFRIFSLLTTIAAVMCDWTQLNYYTQLSLCFCHQGFRLSHKINTSKWK